jgi:hypothetical protein
MPLIQLPRSHSRLQRHLIHSTDHDMLFGGRRLGKTHTGCIRTLRSGCTDPGLYWWVGLSWRSASMKYAWSMMSKHVASMWRALGEKPDDYIKRADKELILPNETEIWFRTAERPESLAGAGVKGAVLDEFSLFREAVWTEYIDGTLIDHDGWAFMIGVPKGENWAAKMWRKAKAKQLGPRWHAWHATSYDNPLWPAERIDARKLTTPRMVFEQEYLAKIVGNSQGVFAGVTEAATAAEQLRALPDHLYVAGIDWGQTNDFTVIMVLDQTTHDVAYYERYNKLSYPEQLKKIRAVLNIYEPYKIVGEMNSMGRPLVQQLQTEGVPITGFDTTNQSKTKIIQQLQVAIEQRHIGLLPDERMLDELMAYEFQQTKLGAMTYNAPEGMHDDIVMALAIAWNACNRGVGITL